MLWLERWMQVPERDASNGEGKSISWWKVALHLGCTLHLHTAGKDVVPLFHQGILEVDWAILATNKTAEYFTPR